jgi:hypothetical protein
MTHKGTFLSLVALICALPAGLLHAQSVPVAQFKTSFPFYISGQKMPAGSYMVTQPNIDLNLIVIRDMDWSHSVLVMYNRTQSNDPVTRGEVTFHQYGDADYLSALTLTGEETGMEIPASTAEQRIAQSKQTVASTKSVALQFGVTGY